jgi:gamma-glutamylcyclotransferase (GGCT)/AIG2-like uncharacterized protein YtfP
VTSLYFAYGSNMSLAQMADRCPASPRVGIGKLDGHRLVFPRFSTKRKCGAASIEPCPDEHVWGVIYDMDPADLIALDGYEGYNPQRAFELNNYNRKQVRILRDREDPVECLTYVATVQPGEFFPSVHYHGLIHSGAIENGIPDAYVQKLVQIPTLTL